MERRSTTEATNSPTLSVITLQFQHTKAALTPNLALQQTLQELRDGFAAVGVSLNPHNRTHCVMSRCGVQVFKCITGRRDWLWQNLLQRKRRVLKHSLFSMVTDLVLMKL